MRFASISYLAVGLPCENEFKQHIENKANKNKWYLFIFTRGYSFFKQAFLVSLVTVGTDRSFCVKVVEAGMQVYLIIQGQVRA